MMRGDIRFRLNRRALLPLLFARSFRPWPRLPVGLARLPGRAGRLIMAHR
jgi:hypothetical protein